MKITLVEEPNREPELILHCADANAPSIQRLLALLQSHEEKIPVQESGLLQLIEAQTVLYAEYVNRRVFLYTADAVLPTPLSLAQLEAQFPLFFRCSKSMVLNLHRVTALKSDISGRILATLENQAQILISRHYAAALRKGMG